MTRHHQERLLDLATMIERYGHIMDMLETLTHEAAREPNWKFLQSRMTLLERQIGGLCNDAQVALYERRRL